MTFELMFIYVCTAISIHRIWIYESIFENIRRATRRYQGLKLLWCPPCFAFWASVLALPALMWPEYAMPLVAYAGVRLAMRGYEDDEFWKEDSYVTDDAPASVPFEAYRGITPGPPSPPSPPSFASLNVPEPACKSCQEKAQKATKATKSTKPPATAPRTLIILTALADFDPSYSLVTVILDQCRAGMKAGFRVELWGMDQMRIVKLPADLKSALEGGMPFNCRGVLPHVGWEQDVLDDEKEEKVYQALIDTFKSAGVGLISPPVIITHDFVFQSWYVILAKVMHRIADEGDHRDWSWYHQLHSSTGDRPPAPVAQWRARVPLGHKMAAVNYSDIAYLSTYYQSGPDSFISLPNSRDIRQFMHMPADAIQVIENLSALDRDVVQTYPLSSPRMAAKGVRHVIDVFAALKKQGRSVLLILANAHADGDGAEQVQDIKAYARIKDLGNDVAFTSEIISGSASVGLSEDAVRSLLLVSNIFCFPSVSEACGLVMLEAALAGNLLVLNESLPVLADFIPHDSALYVPWGSAKQAAPPIDVDALASLIWDELSQNKMNIGKRRVMRELGVDGLAETMRKVL